MLFLPAMAGKRTIDVFVIDNKPELGYLGLLHERGYSVELVRNLSEENKRKFFRCDAQVFIICYMLDQTISVRPDGKPVGSGVNTGIRIAETIRMWEQGTLAKRKYIHIVSSCAEQEKPYFSSMSWKEMMEKGIIDSYSTRDIDNFRLHLKSIEDALK
jgi:hypothetical protein